MRDRYRTSARRTRRAWRRGEDSYAVMVLGPDESLWLLACAAVGRWVFRHRSALVPVLLTGAAFLTGMVLHAHHPDWTGPLAGITAGVTVVLGTPHALLRQSRAGRIVAGLLTRLWWVCGLDRPIERAYAAVVVAAGGGWMTAAIAHGPTSPPLPTVALAALVVLGIPWWVHRRRRARVRVERTIAAWPNIADTIGLTGAHIVSVVVDGWGWTAQVVQRGGKTLAQAIDKIPAIESAFGLRPGSVRVFGDKHRADRFTLRVIETDPHAEPIPWPSEVITSITQPVPLGLFEDGSPVMALLLRRHVLVGGMVGSGKSGILNVIMAHLVACPDVWVWGIDLKGGMELQPWRRCLYRLATTPEDAVTLLAGAVKELDRRAALLATLGVRVWEPAPASPALIIVIDEYAELPPEAHEYTDSLARRGRAVAVNLLAATQRPTQDAMGQGAVRSQMDIRICLRVRERRDVDLILGQGAFSSGWQAHILTQPGTFLISAPEHTTPQRARGYLITDRHITRHVSTHTRPPHVPRPRQAPEGRPDDPDGAQTAEQTPASARGSETPETALWAALRRAGPDGVPVRELLTLTGMTRPTLYRHLRAHAKAGRAVQTTRGAWRALPTPPPHRRPTTRADHPPAGRCAGPTRPGRVPTGDDPRP